MTLTYWMMVERYPHLKEEVGGSISGYEISSLLDKQTCQVVNYLLCFGTGMLAFCNLRGEPVFSVMTAGWFYEKSG
jgi:hypothetical protein